MRRFLMLTIVRALRFLTAAALSFLFLCPRAQGVGDITKYDARTFYETTTYFVASFSSDESSVLITSDASGVFNAYRQPVGGGTPTKLTDSRTNAIIGVDYFPHDDRILISQDEGGNELNHLYVRQLDGK